MFEDNNELGALDTHMYVKFETLNIEMLVVDVQIVVNLCGLMAFTRRWFQIENKGCTRKWTCSTFDVLMVCMHLRQRQRAQLQFQLEHYYI